MSGSEIVRKIRDYITELAVTKEGKITLYSNEIFQQVPRRDPFTTEAYAGLQAIKLGIRLGVNKIEVMGDSKNVIKKCQSTSIDKSVIGAIIRNIQIHRNSFQETEFIFIPKAKNIYTHTIAKEALRRNESFYLEKEVPEMVRRAVGNLWPKPPD
ncbi:hypothetical protein Goshw_001215 [Gossypium schwendimanii]|uniref:RNase H type-1 domain-containing protein n=1 Tax=Gossypium schwendimanii TaxID=34291 RepID=A0A7J9MZA9_GOSSC|nr:hypothetical protein [Gossypium schwendimanii]